jgi:hypothetical protein
MDLELSFNKFIIRVYALCGVEKDRKNVVINILYIRKEKIKTPFWCIALNTDWNGRMETHHRAIFVIQDTGLDPQLISGGLEKHGNGNHPAASLHTFLSRGLDSSAPGQCAPAGRAVRALLERCRQVAASPARRLQVAASPADRPARALRTWSPPGTGRRWPTQCRPSGTHLHKNNWQHRYLCLFSLKVCLFARLGSVSHPFNPNSPKLYFIFFYSSFLRIFTPIQNVFLFLERIFLLLVLYIFLFLASPIFIKCLLIFFFPPVLSSRSRSREPRSRN